MSFRDFVFDQLSGLGPATARSMFGGWGSYLEGVMFAIVHKDRSYLKVDDGSRAAYEAEGMERFRPNAPQTLRLHYEVPRTCWKAPGMRWRGRAERWRLQ